MTPHDIFKIVGTTALACYGATLFSSVTFEISSESVEGTFLNFPAQVVSLLALIVCGSWAALGIAVGSVFWNVGHLSLDLGTALILSGAHVVASLGALGMYRTSSSFSQKTGWHPPTLQDLLLFSLLYTTLTLLTYQLVGLLTTKVSPLSLEDFIRADLGTVAGMILTFVLLNLGMSGYLTLKKQSY